MAARQDKFKTPGARIAEKSDGARAETFFAAVVLDLAVNCLGVFGTVEVVENVFDHLPLVLGEEARADFLVRDEPVVVHLRAERVLEGKTDRPALFFAESLVERADQSFRRAGAVGDYLCRLEMSGHSGQWPRCGNSRGAGHCGFEEFPTGDLMGATVTLEGEFCFHEQIVALELALASTESGAAGHCRDRENLICVRRQGRLAHSPAASTIAVSHLAGLLKSEAVPNGGFDSFEHSAGKLARRRPSKAADVE